MQKELPIVEPILPTVRTTAFDDPGWLFELKYDGYRGMAYLLDGKTRLRGKTTHVFQGFSALRSALEYELHLRDSILDGEIVALDDDGAVDFSLLMRHRGHICYFAFDLLMLNGEDLRRLPLLERKKRLRNVLPDHSETVFYVDHIVGSGKKFFELIKQRDLEGIVAKPADSPYTKGVKWYKIRNPRYSQKEGRHEEWGEIRGGKKAG